jgi:6-phosphofructokinase
MLNNQVIDKRISVVSIPKTMDNDILWVWQSFGFLSAVEKAKEFIVQLNTEAKSNPRLCIVQLFGSDSGFVVSHAALASGACMAALIPEVNFTMKKLSSDITKRLWDKYYHRDQEYGGQSPFGLVLLGETAIPQDVEDYIDNFKSYPDLGLEEGEKEAIRKFMNSSLLCRTDVKDWEALINELNNSTDDSPCRRLLDLLPCEVKGILERTSALEDDNFKFLVLISFNNILKMEDFYIPELFNNLSFTAEFNEVNSILNDVKEITETDSLVIEGDMIKSLVQKLENVPISCEAKEILNLLKNRSKREGEDWENVSRQENLPFFQRLRKRLTEKFNRLLLEVIFSDQIISRSSSLQRERRVQGQTPDELRKGGVKIVSGVLKKDIQGLNDDTGYFRKYRVFVNEPRHLIRAIAPSVSDVIFGQRLGTLAVDNAMAGYTDFMVSQWLTEYVMVPLKLVVLGRKRVPPNGIFWKSVLAGTGQEPEMV